MERCKEAGCKLICSIDAEHGYCCEQCRESQGDEHGPQCSNIKFCFPKPNGLPGPYVVAILGASLVRDDKAKVAGFFPKKDVVSIDSMGRYMHKCDAKEFEESGYAFRLEMSNHNAYQEALSKPFCINRKWVYVVPFECVDDEAVPPDTPPSSDGAEPATGEQDRTPTGDQCAESSESSSSPSKNEEVKADAPAPPLKDQPANDQPATDQPATEQRAKQQTATDLDATQQPGVGPGPRQKCKFEGCEFAASRDPESQWNNPGGYCCSKCHMKDIKHPEYAEGGKNHYKECARVWWKDVPESEKVHGTVAGGWLPHTAQKAVEIQQAEKSPFPLLEKKGQGYVEVKKGEKASSAGPKQLPLTSELKKIGPERSDFEPRRRPDSESPSPMTPPRTNDAELPSHVKIEQSSGKDSSEPGRKAQVPKPPPPTRPYAQHASNSKDRGRRKRQSPSKSNDGGTRKRKSPSESKHRRKRKRKRESSASSSSSSDTTRKPPLPSKRQLEGNAALESNKRGNAESKSKNPGIETAAASSSHIGGATKRDKREQRQHEQRGGKKKLQMKGHSKEKRAAKRALPRFRLLFRSCFHARGTSSVASLRNSWKTKPKAPSKFHQ